MAKTVNLENISIDSQEQLDDHIKQKVVGESLLGFNSLNIKSNDDHHRFELELIHDSIENMVVPLHQLLDEFEIVEEKKKVEIDAYFKDTITRQIKLFKLNVDRNIQNIHLLFDAYIGGNYQPEILTMSFVLCSFEKNTSRQTNSIDLTIDRFIEHYESHSDIFIKALKHVMSSELDEYLEKAKDMTSNLELKDDIEEILNFRKDNK